MKKLLRIFLCVMAVILCTTATLAHGGRTDINGGHTDKNNTSGLGRYHYHCDGNPAHLHEDGICPYNGNKPGYYFNGEWHEVDLPDFDMDVSDYTEGEYTGEIKLKEVAETEEMEEESTANKVFDIIELIVGVPLFLLCVVVTFINPVVGVGVLLWSVIKKIIDRIKNRKDQP